MDATSLGLGDMASWGGRKGQEMLGSYVHCGLRQADHDDKKSPLDGRWTLSWTYATPDEILPFLCCLNLRVSFI